MIDSWKNRYNVKEFEDTLFPEEIEYLKQVFEFIPVQQGIINHFWVLLGPEDLEFKDWLMKNIYNTKGEYMWPIKNAPYVFLSNKIETPTPPQNVMERDRSIGIHAGVLLAECLKLNLDVAMIACTDGTGKKSLNSYNNYMREHYDLTKYPCTYANPSVAVCVGKGLPLKEVMWETREGLRICTGQKTKKPFTNFEEKKNEF